MSVASRSAASQAFAARARRRRLRRMLGVMIAMVVTGGLLALAWLIGWSNVLAVKDVEVVGVRGEFAAQVVDVAQAPVGTPLARVDTDAVASRVQELPETKAVDVQRSWPSTLTIDVTPRVAQAAVKADEYWYDVDESGTMFGQSQSRPEGLPVMEAPADDEDHRVRAAGVAVLTGLPDEVLELVQSVQARSEADIRLVLDEEVTVELGTADELERKAEVLLAVMNAQDETPSGYDVSAPSNPAVTPAHP